uniref:cytochrome P450 2K1-like n=1 Tax=Solea senegalensis TaxID=28829 RepID=UPI001CD87F1D|nr:cytochrome P450 2K1-like [Solea senegalensis]
METPGAFFVSRSGAATVLLLLLLSTVSTSRSSFQDGRRRPPGPRPLPMLGNQLQLDHKKPQKTFMEWSKENGSVFRGFMGQKKVVVLSGFKAVKEALVNYADEFRGRDQKRIVHEYNQGHGDSTKLMSWRAQG